MKELQVTVTYTSGEVKRCSQSCSELTAAKCAEYWCQSLFEALKRGQVSSYEVAVR